MECIQQFPEVVAAVGQVGVEWIRVPWGGISMDGSLHQGWQKREESIHRWAAHIIYRGHQGPYHTMIFLAPFPLGHHSFFPPYSLYLFFLNEGIEMPRDFASHSLNILSLIWVLVLWSVCAECFKFAKIEKKKFLNGIKVLVLVKSKSNCCICLIQFQ